MPKITKDYRHQPGWLPCGVFLVGMLSASAALSAPALWDYQIDVDGQTVSSCEVDSFFVCQYNTVADWSNDIDFSAFFNDTGLGTVSLEISAAGNHTVLGYFDHEFGGSFVDETGSATNESGLASGQSWEIDDPFLGNVFDHLASAPSALDNTNAIPNIWAVFEEADVAMAIGWDFFLAANQKATVAFILSETAPTAGFYLTHSDMVTSDDDLRFDDDLGSVHFWSTLTITSLDTNPDDGNDQEPNPVPLPSTLLLMMSALATVLPFARRKSIA